MSILRRELLIGCAVLTFSGTLGVAYYQDNSERTREIPMSAAGRLARDIVKGALSSEKLQDLTTRISALGTQGETAVAVDSTGMHVVIGFNDFRGLQGSIVSISGFAYSDDGGLTWVDGGQLPTPGSDVVFGQ